MDSNSRKTAKSGDGLLLLQSGDGTAMHNMPLPSRDQISTPSLVPINSHPKRRPIGAVATAMVSGKTSPTGSVERRQEEVATYGEHATEVEQSHSSNPYDLKAVAGSTVTASYPFRGETHLQQLSFSVSPSSCFIWQLKMYYANIV